MSSGGRFLWRVEIGRSAAGGVRLVVRSHRILDARMGVVGVVHWNVAVAVPQLGARDGRGRGGGSGGARVVLLVIFVARGRGTGLMLGRGVVSTHGLLVLCSAVMPSRGAGRRVRGVLLLPLLGIHGSRGWDWASDVWSLGACLRCGMGVEESKVRQPKQRRESWRQVSLGRQFGRL